MADFGATQIRAVRSYILKPPNVWYVYNLCDSRVGTADPKDVAAAVYSELAKKLGLPRPLREKLVDWAAQKIEEKALEQLFKEFPAAKIAKAVMDYFLKVSKGFFYTGMNLKLPPGFNAYEPDMRPGSYVDYLLTAWGAKGMLCYKSQKKSAQELGDFQDKQWGLK